MQPEKLAFTSNIGKPGFALETNVNLYLPDSIINSVNKKQFIFFLPAGGCGYKFQLRGNNFSDRNIME